MLVRLSSFALLLIANVAALGASGLWLIRPDELAALRSEERNRKLVDSAGRPEANAPEIELVAPGNGSAISSPFAIRLRFKPAAGSSIQTQTLSIRYELGMVSKDITARVLEKAKLTETGMELEQANIPAGSHKLRVSIRDSQDRLGEMRFTLTVL